MFQLSPRAVAPLGVSIREPGSYFTAIKGCRMVRTKRDR